MAWSVEAKAPATAHASEMFSVSVQSNSYYIAREQTFKQDKLRQVSHPQKSTAVLSCCRVVDSNGLTKVSRCCRLQETFVSSTDNFSSSSASGGHSSTCKVIDFTCLQRFRCHFKPAHEERPQLRLLQQLVDPQLLLGEGTPP